MGIHIYIPPAIPADEPAREAAVIASGLLHAGRATALRDIVHDAAQRFGASMASASLIHRDRQKLIASVGIAVKDTARSTSFCGHAILRPYEVMCVPDALEDERFAENPLVLGEPHIRFYAAAPLLGQGGHAIGALCVLDDRPRAALSSAEQQLLRQLAARIMVTTHPAQPRIIVH